MNRHEVIRHNLRLRDLSHTVFKYDYFLEGKTENLFKLYDESYSCVVLDNNHIACIELESSLIDIWNINTGNKIRSLHGHLKKIDNLYQVIEVLQLLPDGRLISGSTDNTVRIWNWHTGECEVILQGENSVSNIILLSSGKLAVGYFDGIKIWNLNTLEVEMEMQQDEIENRSFLEINNHIVSGSYQGGDVTLFNLRTGKVTNYNYLFKNGSYLKIFDKNSFICISSEDKLNIWRVKNDELKIDKSFQVSGIVNFFVINYKIIYFLQVPSLFKVKLLDINNGSKTDLGISGTYLKDVKILPDNNIAVFFTNHLNIYDLEDNSLDMRYEGSKFNELIILDNKLLVSHYKGGLTILR